MWGALKEPDDVKRGDAIVRWILWGWMVFTIGVYLMVPAPSPAPNLDPDQNVLAAGATLVLFALVLVRIAVAARFRRAQRPALLALLLGQVLWCLASLVVVGTTNPDIESLSPAEWFMAGAYIGYAAFLFLDGEARRRVRPTSWIDAVVLTGGAACLAILIAWLPGGLATNEPMTVAQAVALLYPISDIILALVVAIQVVLRYRRADLRALLLIAAFLAFTVGDGLFAVSLSSASYDYSLVMQVAWGVAITVLAQAASMRRVAVLGNPVRAGRAWWLVAASALAVVVVALPGNAIHAWWVQLPALATLIASGARLVLALRESQRATDAFRASLVDELTDLPNRRGLVAVLEGGELSSPKALLAVGIRGFREVTDSFGHDAGDEMVKIQAARLSMLCGPRVRLGRMSTDTFGVITEGMDYTGVVALGRRLQEAAGVSLQVGGVDVVPGMAVGVALEQPGEPGEQLLRRAAAALSQADRSFNDVVVYDPHRDELGAARLRIADQLRRALAENQLTVWYQPQVDPVHRKVRGVEALLRWDAPEGLHLPGEFLAAARVTGLMPALTNLAVACVVRDAAAWAAQGRTWRVSVNVATPELLSGAVIPRLIDYVGHTDLRSIQLVVEVTEESFLADPDHARDVLADLKHHGVQVSVDDYGTGFSSLSYLHTLHADELKIDRSFITSLTLDAATQLIVRSTTDMAQALGLRVVAEGVERADQAEDLMATGVDLLQGFHYSPAVPRPDLEAWADEWEAA